MAGARAHAMGTSAYDLDRLAALPEIAVPEEPRRRRGEVVAPPTEQTRERVQSRGRAQGARRQHVSIFGVLGCALVGALLMLIVLSHMQLAMISSEMVDLERQMSRLRTENIELQMAHEAAFGLVEVERFAREELGMVDATRGQVVFIGSGITGDTAEVLRVNETSSTYGLFEHITGLFGVLRESWSSIFGR